MSQRSEFTITAQEAAGLIGQPGTAFVDASWYLPAQNRDGRAEFDEIRIPGAVYFDIDEISDRDSPLPHMLPSPDTFAQAVGGMGIAHTDEIIVYDGPGLFSCARVWWMFRIMGARNVRIVDGGFDSWRKKGLPTERGLPEPIRKAVFQPDFDASRVKSIADIRANMKTGAAMVLDARPYGRFTGEVPEPRPGLRSGHIPGSHSLPFSEFVENGKLKDITALKAIFGGLSLDREAITTCGSGVTAAVISLALESVGHTNNSLYDGSWAEWGQAEDAPIAQWEDGRG